MSNTSTATATINDQGVATVRANSERHTVLSKIVSPGELAATQVRELVPVEGREPREVVHTIDRPGPSVELGFTICAGSEVQVQFPAEAAGMAAEIQFRW